MKVLYVILLARPDRLQSQAYSEATLKVHILPLGRGRLGGRLPGYARNLDFLAPRWRNRSRKIGPRANDSLIKGPHRPAASNKLGLAGPQSSTDKRRSHWQLLCFAAHVVGQLSVLRDAMRMRSEREEIASILGSRAAPRDRRPVSPAWRT